MSAGTASDTTDLDTFFSAHLAETDPEIARAISTNDGPTS